MRQNVVKNVGDTETSQEFNEGIGQELNSCIEGAGLSFDNNDDKQLLQSISIVASNRMSYKEVAGSTGSAYIIQTYENNIEPLQSVLAGCKIRLYLTNTNTTTAPTLKFDNLPTVYNIKKSDGTNVTQELLQTGTIISLLFNGTDFILENELVTERNINELNTYTVSSFTSNTYNLQNLIKNPLSYYNGLVVIFKATSTCTTTPKINVNSLGDVNIVDIQKQTLTASEILQNDIIECVYYDTEFHIIKKSSKIKNDIDLLSFQNNSGQYVPSINLNDNERINSNTSLTQNDINKFISIDNSSALTITMPLVSSLSSNSKFILNSEKSKNIIFLCSSSDNFLVDDDIKTSFTVNVENCLIIISKIANGLFSVSYTKKSTNDLHGVVIKGTQTQVNGGTDPDVYVTPETLYNTPFIGNLNVIYPIGSLYFNADPSFVVGSLPGAGTFTWEEVTDAHAIIATTTAATAGTEAGVQNTVGGLTNSTTLSIAQIPQHDHDVTILTDGEAQKIGGGASNTVFRNSKTYTTTQKGGGQPHNHGLNIKSYYSRVWKRTA